MRDLSFARSSSWPMAYAVKKAVVVTFSGAVLLAGASPALAAEPAGGPPPDEPTAQAPAEAERDIDPDEGVPRAPALDLRGGSWLFSVAGAVMVPSADLVPSAPGFGSLTVGGGVRGAIGFGISRHVLLRLDGGAGWLTGSELCEDCSALSVDVGAGLVYHLAQAIAFDPWISYGAAYRYSASSMGDDTLTAHGIDVARLSIGGDYYPVAAFGFGPFIETDIGLNVDPDPLGYVAFLAGLRFTLDPLRAGTQIEPTSIARR